ncbi:unnamed protein product [Prunus armeniaca]|uniref:Uncharacterized protein n=1 Tax=Prunus armeniaca TaxID=36596 RepID=A0A6J5W4X6_PRUAR|nr:unnamed protein product [Prunus armeniaca]
MPTLLCRLLIDGVVVFFDMSFVFFIAWLVFQPRLPELRVDSASVFTLNDTRFELIATWDLTLLAANPWLVFQPHLSELRVDSASVFTLNDTRFELITTWDLTLLAANPNHKLIIYYDNIHATIPTHDYRLAKTSLPPLF